MHYQTINDKYLAYSLQQLLQNQALKYSFFGAKGGSV